MKKITLLLTIMTFVLAFGSAYAMDMNGEMRNGITVFTAGPVTYDSVPSAAVETELLPASGWNEAETYAELNNGITIFAVGPVDFDSVPTYGGAAKELIGVGSAAGGLREDSEPLGLYNGITIFDRGVIDAD